jgi:hypothetical protein
VCHTPASSLEQTAALDFTLEISRARRRRLLESSYGFALESLSPRRSLGVYHLGPLLLSPAAAVAPCSRRHLYPHAGK